MVFCGKPSKGCGQCRSRKIRCDQVRPACSQCTKANRECPGYRDELSLMFRDESQQVMQRAKTAGSETRAKPSKSASRASRRSSPRSDTSSQSGTGPLVPIESSRRSETPDLILDEVFDFNTDPHRDMMQQVIENPLTVQPSSAPTEFEATCFFLRYNNWPGAFWMKSKNTSGFFGSQGSASQQTMKASIASAGAAMLSRIKKSEPLKVAAERQYGSALALMNTAVSDKVEAKSNSTLAAVLVLAIFEVVTSRAPTNIENWTNHIHGAASLLELRGVEQLQTEEGLGLFLQLRFQIIISCLQRAARVPQSVVECSRIAMFLRPQAEAYGDSLIRICGKVSNLRADISSKTITNRAEILSAAYAAEGELMGWLAGLPSDFAYTTVDNNFLDPSFMGRSREIHPYDNRYHIYRSFWLCNVWNQYRTVRIVTNDIILTYLHELSSHKRGVSLPSDLQGQLSTIRSTIRRLAEDICASVPYNFGAGEIDHASGWSPTSESFIGGYVLLWPLFLAGMTKFRDHPMRKWTGNCLQLVGNSMGIDQALALVDILETEEYFSPDPD